MPTIPQEIAESTQVLTDNAAIVQQFAQGTANIQIPTAGGNLRPLSYWQAWFQTELEAMAQPYVDQIADSTQAATSAAQSASVDAQQTALDRIATGQDAQQTGLDRQSATSSAQSASDDAQQTGLDRIATGEDRAAAAQSAVLAAQLANAPEDVEVEPGIYSAFHWMRKAESTIDLSNYYTKTEVDNQISSIDLSAKADKTYVDQQLGDIGSILDAINGV